MRPNAYGICIAAVNEHGCTEKLVLTPADLKNSGCADRVLSALEKRFALGPLPKWKWATARTRAFQILQAPLCGVGLLANIYFGEVALPAFLGLFGLVFLGAVLWHRWRESRRGASPDENTRRLRKAGWLFPRDGAGVPGQGEHDTGSAEEVTH